MPKAQQELDEINRYLTTWITEIAVSNSLTYFDINKVSEGTALQLLKLLYGWQLIDLNEEKQNYPGIDLGDKDSARLAVQVTSRTDSSKIKSTLQTFLVKDYFKRFPNGLRFLLLSSQKRPRLTAQSVSNYRNFFEPQKHIILIQDLLIQSRKLYYDDRSRFEQLRDFLKREFGQQTAQPRNGLISFKNSADRLLFFKKVFSANHYDFIRNFVPVEYLCNKQLFLSDGLDKQNWQNNGLVIYGPSGCGKSAFARQIAVSMISQFLPVIIEAKYYENGLQNLFNKEVQSYGFNSDAEFLAEAAKHEQGILLILDGFNECKTELRSKLIIELKKAVEDKGLRCLITTQVQEPIMQDFEFKEIFILPPSQEVRESIASAYHGFSIGNKLKPILSAVSTGLEAKMIGEIGSQELNNSSRFVLFATFIRLKLKDAIAGGFSLMAMIAKSMSENITFSLTLRVVDSCLLKHQISPDIYTKCLQSGILNERSGKVSFNHEMFFNFFVAESVARFASNAEEIIEALNAPKNADKKVLIIGSIDDQGLIDKVLSEITDAEVFNALLEGEAGEYCQLWVNRQIANLLPRINAEVVNAELEFAETPHHFQFVEDKLTNWSEHDLALLYAIQGKLLNGDLLEQVLNITGDMDDVCYAAVKQFWEESKAKNISARTDIFLATYSGIWQRKLALSRLFSSLHSNFQGLREREKISIDRLTAMIKGKTLKPGQIYLLLLLFRWDDRLKGLSSYALYILRNWRQFPYHLLSEILQQIGWLFNDDEQRSKIVEAITTIHVETRNVWLSTEIFDALSALGELEEDSNEYISVVNNEIDQVLNNPNDKTACENALGIFNRQFDHPYDSAYYTAIEQLPEEKKTLFLEMALQGGYSSMFTVSLIMRAVQVLGYEAMRYIGKWTEMPIIEPTFPQDSLGVFMVAHLLLGQHNYPLPLRNINEPEKKDNSMRALAELYYWQNRSDIDVSQKDEYTIPLENFFFSAENSYGIETLWQSRNALHQQVHYGVLDLRFLKIFETIHKEQIVSACRRALSDLNWVESIWKFGDRRVEMNQHAIYLLSDVGTIVDLDVLRPLANDVDYGRSAVDAIKKLGG